MTGIRLSKRPSSLVQGAFFLVLRLSNPLPCHNLPPRRRLIPFSLIRWPPALGDPRKYCPEASLPPIPTSPADRLPLGPPWPAPGAFLCSPCRLWSPPTSSTRCLCSSGGSTAMEPRLLVSLGRWACKCTGSGTCGGRVASPVVLFHSESCQRGPRAPPGITPPSPQVPTGDGRARWAPMATAGA